MQSALTALLCLAFLLPASVSSASLPSRAASESIATATNTLPLTYRGQSAYRVSDGRTKVYVAPGPGREVVFGWVGGPNLLEGAEVEQAGKPVESSGDTAGVASVLADRRLRLIFPVQASIGTRRTREYYYNPAGELVISESVQKVSGPTIALSLGFGASIAPPLSTPLSRTGDDYAAIGSLYDGCVFVQRVMMPADRPAGESKPALIPDVQKGLTSNTLQTSLRVAPEYTFKVGDTIRWSVRWSLHRLPPGGAASPETRAEVERLLAPPSQ